jgi:DNA-directed RNA polymerase specialized sigma24 family protein
MCCQGLVDFVEHFGYLCRTILFGELVMDRYEITDFSDSELQELMDRFWDEYGSDVDFAIDHVIRSCRHVVEPLTKNYYFDEDDIRAECRLAILRHVPWLMKKGWLDSSLNPRGYFYTVARNRVIDLYKRYESRHRSGVAYPQSFYDVHTSLDCDKDIEETDLLDFADLMISEDNTIDLVVRNNELSEMLILLAKRLIYLERLASRYIKPDDWFRYMEWWNKQLESSL